MTVEWDTNSGKIEVSGDVVSNMAGRAAMDCYGIVGMASQSAVKDGISEMLKRENLGRGVDVQYSEDGVVVNLYIIVSYGTKISEVARNVQQKVRYALKEHLGLETEEVNVFVQGVKVLDQE